MRFPRSLALAASVALAATGCVNPRMGNLVDLGVKPAAPTPTAGSLPANQPELPVNQQAALSMTMAEDLERQHKESDALAYYENARQLDPSLNDKASRRLAVLYDRHNQQAKGMIEFQQLLKKYPKDSTLLNDVGYSHYNRGQWTEAESFLRRATSADKTNSKAWTNLGMTLAQQGKYEEAFAVFTKVVSPAEAHANIGFILALHPDRQAESIQAYRQALAIEPAHIVAQKALQRLEERAAKVAETATNPDPTEKNRGS